MKLLRGQFTQPHVNIALLDLHFLFNILFFITLPDISQKLYTQKFWHFTFLWGHS